MKEELPSDLIIPKRDDANIITPKQQEVLNLIALGFRNKEIAERMHLSVSTVKLHVSGLMLRLDVRSRTAAVVEAQRLGLLNKNVLALIRG